MADLTIVSWCDGDECDPCKPIEYVEVAYTLVANTSQTLTRLVRLGSPDPSQGAIYTTSTEMFLGMEVELSSYNAGYENIQGPFEDEISPADPENGILAMYGPPYWYGDFFTVTQGFSWINLGIVTPESYAAYAAEGFRAPPSGSPPTSQTINIARIDSRLL